MIQCPACQNPIADEFPVYLRHGDRVYYRCHKCGSIHAPGAEPSPDVYNAEYFDKFRSFSGGRDQRALNTLRLDFVQPFIASDGKRIAALDFGCGSGDWLEDLRNCMTSPALETVPMYGPHVVVVGVDINPHARNFIKEHFPHVAVFDRLEAARVWYRHQFDIVTAFDVIEHFADPGEIMETLADSTKDGGVLVLSTPYLPPEGFTPEEFKAWRHCRPSEHFCHFTIRGIDLFLKRYGLEMFTFGHPEDGVRRPGPNALSPHNILTIIARKEGSK